jgi:hypothetical protein
LGAAVFVVASMLTATPSARAAEQSAVRFPLSGAAMCNDGEPAVLYFRSGTGANRSKYLIVLQVEGCAAAT